MDSSVGWTYRVALNVARRRARRRRIEATLLRRRGPERTELDGPAGEAWAVVADLPLRQRQVVVLRYVADLTEADIASALGISRSTVSSTLADARRTLGRHARRRPRGGPMTRPAHARRPRSSPIRRRRRRASRAAPPPEPAPGRPGGSARRAVVVVLAVAAAAIGARGGRRRAGRGHRLDHDRVDRPDQVGEPPPAATAARLGRRRVSCSSRSWVREPGADSRTTPTAGRGGCTVPRLDRWTGESWSPLGLGFAGQYGWTRARARLQHDRPQPGRPSPSTGRPRRARPRLVPLGRRRRVPRPSRRGGSPSATTRWAHPTAPPPGSARRRPARRPAAAERRVHGSASTRSPWTAPASSSPGRQSATHRSRRSRSS